MLRVDNIQELACFEMITFLLSLCKCGKKAVISKQESFSTNLSRSCIVFTLVTLQFKESFIHHGK